MIGCLRTRVRKQPIIALYFESENELKFYNLEAWWPFCYVGSKIVSEYDQEIPITNRRQPRGTGRKSCSTITRHQEDKLSKATSSLSLPHQDDYNTRMDIK